MGVSSTVKGFAILGLLAICAEPTAATDHLKEYTWLVVVAGFLAFFTAFGIGANDVANAYATSVGAKSLTIAQAVGLAAVFEFLGAVCLGSQVSETIRKGIADPACFVDNPGLLMWGMTCVIAATGGWLLLASYLEMPVSTTHSCIGGIIGMTMMSRNSDCVLWYEESEDFPFAKGVTAIVISWGLSPIASGICAALLYGFTYVTVLMHEGDTAFRNAKILFPVLVGFTTGLNIVLMILKGASGIKEDLGTDDMISAAKDGDIGPAAAVGGYFALGAFFLAALITPFLASRALERTQVIQDAEAAAANGKGDMEEPAAKEAPVETQAEGNFELTDGVDYIKQQLNSDPHAVLKTDATSAAIHENYKRHDTKVEEMFKAIQVFTAIVDSFSHGANDVANAMGPFAAVYVTYSNGYVNTGKEDVGDEMYWILAIGGVGIVFGLATYGYKIMQAIGVKLVAITPSRGYCIELGAAFVIIYGTTQGWPLSTTHCQVGATVGVGLFEGAAGVNKWVVVKCVVGWVATLVIVGFTAAILVGPSPEPDKSIYCA